MSYFLNTDEIVQTIRMIEQEHLDVRTITLGLSLLDCATGDIKRTADKVYEKICREAHDLVPVGEAIEREFGIPIVNKRVSVTPVALIAGGCGEDLVPIAEAMDRAAREVGVNFIGGFSALVQKGFTTGDRLHSRGACTHRARLRERERRLDARGHQHGRCGGDGPRYQKVRRAHRRYGRTRVLEARRFLQRGGG